MAEETPTLQPGHSPAREQHCPCRENLKKSVCAARTAAEPLPHKHTQIQIWASFDLAFRLQSVTRDLSGVDLRLKPPAVVFNPCLPAILRC